MNLDLFSFYVTFGLAVLYFCVFEVLPCEILCLMFEYHTILDGESDFFIGNTIYRVLIGHVLLKIGNLKLQLLESGNLGLMLNMEYYYLFHSLFAQCMCFRCLEMSTRFSRY